MRAGSERDRASAERAGYVADATGGGEDAAGTAGTAGTSRVRLRPARYTGLVLLLVFIIIFSLWIPHLFLTSSTLKTILAAQGIDGILALSLLFPLAAGVFDLSVAQTLGLGALVCGSLMVQTPHTSPEVAILITLALGAVIGVFNGVLVAVVGVNSFIATLGTSSLLMAVAELVGQGNYVGPFPTAFADLTSSNPGGVPMITIYLFVLAVGLWYVLEHSPIGRRFYATGANLDAARLAGVRTNRYVFVSFVICGLGAGAAGVLLASSLTTVDQTIGSTYLLPPYAAAFLGATQLKPGRFNVWGTIVALFLLGTGVQGLQLAGAEPWVTDLFDGVALISAVSIAVFVEKGRGRDEKRRAAART